MVEAHSVSSATFKPRQLLHGSITYSAAKECERNVLHELDYWDQETKFLSYLYGNRDLIRSIVVRHFGLNSTDKCYIADPEEWMRGSFNVCVRADIDYQARKPSEKAIVRFPLPYRVGELSCPGNANEKILCEVGTYAWLQKNCPDVPIPHLYGFGLTTGQTVCTHIILLVRVLAY